MGSCTKRPAWFGGNGADLARPRNSTARVSHSKTRRNFFAPSRNVHLLTLGSHCMAQLTDEQITKMAKARVGFKVHLMVYVLVNLFLMGVWVFSGGMARMHEAPGWTGADYWPMWTHLGWGLGLAIHGFVLTPEGKGATRVDHELVMEPRGAMRLVGWTMKPMMRKNLRTTMDAAGRHLAP